MFKNRGFTLIELLVVVAIIGILASVVLASLNSAREKSRDARRLSDMRQIQTALDMYYLDNNMYPDRDDNDCGGYDTGFNGGPGSGDTFLYPLQAGGYMNEVPGDPNNTEACGGYYYYRYAAGTSGCDPSRGAFYVLGVKDMESTGRPHPSSPGAPCGG